MKVASSSAIAGVANNSEVYNYPLETPLRVLEGDVLGYFQPTWNYSELDLYLEDSRRLTTYYEHRSINQLSPPIAESVFSLDSALKGTRYPLIAIETGTTKVYTFMLNDFYEN